jgi:2'-5' RNA ligase
MADKDHLKKKDKKRLFIAIDLPEDVKNRLFELTSDMHSRDREIRPVSAGNMHLTLKFLGDVYTDRIDKISRVLDTTACSRRALSYMIGSSFQAFPGVRNARVIYVPVIKGETEIESFFRALEDNLSKIKIRKESRKFVSHITVARVRRKKDVTSILKDINPGYFKECSFNRVTLFESILKPSGAEYIIIDEFELK